MRSLLCKVDLPVDTPASLVVTLVSLAARVLVVTLDFHDKFADQAACSALAEIVSRESTVEIDGLSVIVPPSSCMGLMQQLFCCIPAREQIQREDSTSDI